MSSRDFVFAAVAFVLVGVAHGYDSALSNAMALKVKNLMAGHPAGNKKVLSATPSNPDVVWMNDMSEFRSEDQSKAIWTKVSVNLPYTAVHFESVTEPAAGANGASKLTATITFTLKMTNTKLGIDKQDVCFKIATAEITVGCARAGDKAVIEIPSSAGVGIRCSSDAQRAKSLLTATPEQFREFGKFLVDNFLRDRLFRDGNTFIC